MKVLYYNWAPLNMPGVGGGVSVYVRNIIDYVMKNIEDNSFQIFFLSSGWLYDKSKQTYIREEQKQNNVKCFSIVNSPISAPHRFAVSQLKDFFKENSLKSLFKDFIEEKGPFDVIHFQSIEGLSPNILELKKDFPQSKFIYSIHDYGLFCPNVRLWTDKGTNCYKDVIKRDCSLCMRADETARIWKLAIYLRSTKSKNLQEDLLLSRVKKGVVSRLSSFCGRFKKKNSLGDYISFREKNIEMINIYVDEVLCVSNRVCDIASFFGVNKDKLHVCYIGTKVAELTQYSSATNVDTSIFTILYMGYATPDKGFFLLFDVLESMPKEFQSSTNIKFATKLDNKCVREKVEKLKEKYNQVTVYNGYSHADFPIIMKDVNLGIVPPQWEDNLPQVSIEMIANGVPVLTSNCGGAHELNSSPAFCFKDINDFKQKLLAIKNDRELLKTYWSYSKKLTTMDEHIQKLLELYRQ